MAIAISYLLAALVFLGLEWLFRLAHRGRIVLGSLVFVGALIDALWSASENPGHRGFVFVVSFLDSMVPLMLWQWVSSWIRGSRACLRPNRASSQESAP